MLGQQERGKKHRCLIMLHTKLGQTELALRIYFKNRDGSSMCREPSQNEREHYTHMMMVCNSGTLGIKQ